MLYLAECYTKGPNGEPGWEIKFVWVFAGSRDLAKTRLVDYPDFDEIIQLEEHSDISAIGCEADELGGQYWFNFPRNGIFAEGLRDKWGELVADTVGMRFRAAMGLPAEHPHRRLVAETTSEAIALALGEPAGARREPANGEPR